MGDRWKGTLVDGFLEDPPSLSRLAPVDWQDASSPLGLVPVGRHHYLLESEVGQPVD